MPSELPRLIREYREAAAWKAQCALARQKAKEDYDAAAARLREACDVWRASADSKHEAFARLVKHFDAKDVYDDID